MGQRTKFVALKASIRRDGSCPVCLRVAKEDKTKYIDLQLSAMKGQWMNKHPDLKKTSVSILTTKITMRC